MCFNIDADDFLPAFQKWDDHPARKHFDVLKDLGAGSFSRVVLARHRNTGRLAALKVVFMEGPNVDDETRRMLVKEGEFLSSLSHPNLVRCSDVIISPTAHVFVLEYLRGCSILDGLHRMHDTYSEQDAAGIFKQLAEVMTYLHQEGIIHRDVKPENLQYADPAENVILESFRNLRKDKKNKIESNGKDDGVRHAPLVKLIDLGMAIRYDPADPDRGALGSAGFVAPEVIRGKSHTPAMDIFSMGVLLFIMLVGRKPFNISETENLKYGKMSLMDAPGFKDPRWLDLSPHAKDLLVRMMTFEPSRRLTAKEVLLHEWVVSGGGAVPRLLGPDVALGAAAVAEMRRLRFLCNGVVALRRTAAAATAQRYGRQSTLAEEDVSVHAFRNALKRIQKQESSVHAGRSFRGIARNVTAKSFVAAHDAGIGGSVHSHNIHVMQEQSVREGRAFTDADRTKQERIKNAKSTNGAMRIGQAMSDGAGNFAGRAAVNGSSGMKRSGTAVILSELLQDPEAELRVKDRVMRDNPFVVDSKMSGASLLRRSIKQYLDVSVHGGRSARLGSRERQAGEAEGDDSGHRGDDDLDQRHVMGSPCTSDGEEFCRVVKVRPSCDGTEQASRSSMDGRSSSDGRMGRSVVTIRPM